MNTTVSRAAVLMFFMFCTTTVIGQVGKRTKLLGNKVMSIQPVNESASIQIGSLQITETKSHFWGKMGDDALIEALPKEPSLYVVANLSGVSKAFEDGIKAQLPQAEVMESFEHFMVIHASPDEAASLIRNRGNIDMLESLTARRKLAPELQQVMQSLIPTLPERETSPLNMLNSGGLQIREVPEGQVPVLQDEGNPGISLVLDEPKLDVTFYLFQNQPEGSISDAITGAGGNIVAAGSDQTIVAVRAQLPVSKIETVAADRAVREVTLDPEFIKHNDVAAKILARNTTAYVPPISGDGQIVGHADSGLDIGKEATLHEAFRGRLKKAIPLGRPAPVHDWSDRGGHGSHTAGSILGSASFRGIAPKALLVHQSLDDANGRLSGIPTPLGALFEPAYAEGARVHSDSWGVSAIQHGSNLLGGVYLKGAEVDSWLWNNGAPRDMLVVFSAGNDGDFKGVNEPEENRGRMTVTSPGTAKNCLTVGATESVRSNSGASGDNSEELALFSSRGPTKDDRTKPDVVAPGTWIASVRTRGESTPWHDDVENVSITPGSVAAWQVTPGFQHIVDPENCAFSGTQVWRLNRAVGSASFQDVLRTPEVDIPPGHPLSLAVWVRGDAEGLKDLHIGSVGGDGLFSHLRIQQTKFMHWTILSATIPSKYQGTKRRFAVVAQQVAPLPKELTLYFDEFQMTTFESWGFLSSLDLASPYDDLDRNFTLSGGTSMAAPLAAGCATLVRQSLVDSGTAAPSAELIKAILINSADPLASTGARPNFQSGWGLVNLRRAIEGDYEFDFETRLKEQETMAYEITVPEGAKELRVTLVWADPPKEQLVNDLDLTLTSPAGDIVPSADLNGNVDRINNVEGVDRNNPVAGIWKATVKAHKLGEGESQPFSLVTTVFR